MSEADLAVDNVHSQSFIDSQVIDVVVQGERQFIDNSLQLEHRTVLYACLDLIFVVHYTIFYLWVDVIHLLIISFIPDYLTIFVDYTFVDEGLELRASLNKGHP